MHSSALSELRSKQSSPPLLHLDTIGLTSWDTRILDSDDLAGLWNAFTKCKKVLSDGYRLENITWRLWQREKILVSGAKLHHHPHHHPHNDSFLSTTSSTSINSSTSFQSNSTILSDPTSPFTTPISPSISTFSHQPSSFQTNSSNTNLTHLSPSPTPFTPRRSSTQSHSNHHHQSPSRQSSDQSSQSPRDVSHILPPPRPNSITPMSFGAIIDTLLPMDLVAEQAHAKELMASHSKTATPTTNTNATVVTPHLILLDNEHPPDPGTQHPSRAHHPLTYLNPSSTSSSNHSSSASSSSDTPIRLKAPPRIVNIAPTPPSASPAVTAPTSPIMGPASSSSPTQLPFSHIQSLLTVSPSLALPYHLTCSPSTEVDNQSPQPANPTSPSTRQISKSKFPGLQPRRPLSVKRYSSSSTTTSSVGFKSIGTSPSVDERESTSTTSKAASKRPAARGPTSAKHLLNPRRTNSTSGIKLGSTRRPISYLRSVSGGGTTTRSVSPNLGTSKQESEEWNEEGDKVDQHQSIPTFESPSLIGSSRLSKVLVDEPSPLILPTARPSPIPSSSLLPNLLDESTSGNLSNPTSCSSSDPMSPVIPVTPNNSKVSSSPVFKMNSPNNSPSIFLPSAPPPTPAENGVPLPTTMSAGIEKSNAIAAAGIPNPNLQAVNGKKKAKFYINGYETEDDGVLSPPSVPNPAPINAPNPISQGTTASTSSNNPPNPIIGRLRPVEERVISEAEESEDDDEDEWDSTYTDSSDEAEDQAELERKKAQEEYHRQLFAKKSFTVDPSSTPIKRAGLSMLFHPETNASRHHPNASTSSHKFKDDIGRNQSAIELRRRAEGMSSHSSIMTPMRPSSLIKSKSTVAVPILVSNHSKDHLSVATSSSHQSKALPTPVTNLKNLSHPSPIRRKPPIDVEYSSDEDDDEEEDQEEEAEEEEMICAAREVAALPLSPRTTRRNMLANEMTESVRKNLLWERQLRNNLLGVGPVGGSTAAGPLIHPLVSKFNVVQKNAGLVGPSGSQNQNQKLDAHHGSKVGVVNGSGAGTGGTGDGVEKEVAKHFTKGLHRSVW